MTAILQPPSPPAAPPAERVLTPAGIRLLGAAMVGLFALSVSLTPAPDGPEPVLSAGEEIIATVMTWGMAAALVGFLLGRRWALWPALGISALSAVDVGLCPATGHHLVGMWWFGQVVIAAVLLALPAAALARTRAG